MKRFLAAMALGAMAFAAFGLDLGLSLGGRFATSTTSTDITILSSTTTTAVTGLDLEPRIGLVASLPWCQLGVGYFATADLGGETRHEYSDGSSDSTQRQADARSWRFVAVEALFRLPLKAGGLRLTPMAGLEYDACVGAEDASGAAIDASSITDSDGEVAGHAYYSKLAFKLGIGADIPLSRTLALRPWIMAGFGLLSQADSDTKDNALYSGYALFDFRLEAGASLVMRL